MARIVVADGGREERADWNAVLFSERRERVSNPSQAPKDQPGETIDIFCECGLEECFAKVTIPSVVFLRARKQAGRFIVRAGHHAHDGEEVVEAADGYWVVGKRPA